MYFEVYWVVLQYDKYKWVLSLFGFTSDNTNMDFGLHVSSGISGRTNFRCYPSIVNRFGHLVNFDTPNTTFGEIAYLYFLVR